MPTILDVAQRAGVSTATVSHVINQTRFVSVETIEKVQRAMEDLGYRPNVLARSLRSGHSHTIGLVLPDSSNLFFAEVSRVVEETVFEHGYSVIICNTNGVSARERSYLEILAAKQVDGVILISVGGSGQNVRDLVDPHTPVVVTDREFDSGLADTVLLDNNLGGRLAAHYLVSLGHRRIAVISGPDAVNSSAKRVEGFRQALHESGIELPHEYIVRGDYRFSSGEQGFNQLYRQPQVPTAVFACNDMMAIGAIKAAHNLGIKVPEQMSVIGFDDIPLAGAILPALTTIAQSHTEMASIAARLLLQRLGVAGIGELPGDPMVNADGSNNFRNIILQPALVIRESCSSLLMER